MNKLKVFELLLLAGLIFAQVDELDSVKTDLLKRQKLFYSASDNWIPPTIPNESSCIMSGCCLISTGWYTVGRVFFSAKNDTSVKLEKRASSKLNFEVGYSPGICWASGNLMPENPGWLDPTTRFYWLNFTEGMISYRLSSQYRVGIGSGYLWAYLENRGGTLSWGVNRGGAHESTDWRIWGIPLTISTKIFKNDRFSYEFQLNYYFIKGLDIEKAYFGDPSAPVIETVIINCWARGWGGSFRLNYENYLFRRLKFIISSTVKIGKAKEYKNDAPLGALDDAIWDGPVDFFVTGMYVNFGLSHEF